MPVAAGLGHELGADADESARGDAPVEPHPAGAVVHHLEQVPLRVASRVVTSPTYSSGTSMVTCSTGSCSLPSTMLRDDLGLADGQLEAFAAHGLDQDGELQLAAALDLPGVGALGRCARAARRCRRAPGRAGTSPCGRSELVPRGPRAARC